MMLLKLWVDTWMTVLRSTAPRKGSRYGYPEPLDSAFGKVQDELEERVLPKTDDKVLRQRQESDRVTREFKKAHPMQIRTKR